MKTQATSWLLMGMLAAALAAPVHAQGVTVGTPASTSLNQTVSTLIGDLPTSMQSTAQQDVSSFLGQLNTSQTNQLNTLVNGLNTGEIQQLLGSASGSNSGTIAQLQSIAQQLGGTQGAAVLQNAQTLINGVEGQIKGYVNQLPTSLQGPASTAIGDLFPQVAALKQSQTAAKRATALLSK